MNLKSALFLIAAMLLISVGAEAQCTPNDTITTPGYHPPQLPEAWAGTPYQEVLQVLVIKDTSVVFNGIPAVVLIDSAKLKSVIGLPRGFTFECSRPGCVFTPKAVGCALLSGTPEEADTGTYPIDLEIQMFGKIFGSIAIDQSDTLRRFVLRIRSGSASVELIALTGFEIHPNPAQAGVISYSGTIPTQVLVHTAEGRSLPVEAIPNGFRIDPSFRGLSIWSISTPNGHIIRKKVIFTD